MGTRSRFGIVQEDGSILSVYHHWDGYPDWLGNHLVQNYNTPEKIRAVMADGDMSTLQSSHDWNRNELNPPRPLYYKERGENCPAQVSGNKLNFFALTNDCGGEYMYLFENGKWTCYDNDGTVVMIPPNIIT